MGMLQVSLFGKFSAHHGREPVAGLDTSKVQELFCYLLLYRDRPHSREALAGLLWGDNPTEQSRSYLRKTLWQLQTALNSLGEPLGEDILSVEPGWVQLRSHASLQLDVAALEEAFNLVYRLPGRQLDLHEVGILCAAAAHYRGDLLEGWYQDWCLYERERLQHMYLSILDKLMDFCEAREKYESGLLYGAQILRYERARERTHRRLMRLYYLAGDRTAALRQYEQCVATLGEELGVRPAQSTVDLYNQIRADRLPGHTPVQQAERSAPEIKTPSSAEIPDHLEKLQAALTELQQQVEQTMQAIEQARNSC
jgi:DNA-binding SARP family transcriptional activator